MKQLTIIATWIVFPALSFSQEKPDSLCLLDKQLYLGARVSDGKQIVSGFYLNSTGGNSYELDLDVLEDWVAKDSLNTTVVYEASFFCSRALHNTDSLTQKTTCHSFISPDGLLLTLSFQGGTEANRCKVPVLAEIMLPPDRKSYTTVLPVMYFK